ncbi:MAG TPA: DUF6049 family protein, partial [Nitriliruptorales bacterium]
PVRLTVLDGSDALDQVTTSVIYLREPVEQPLVTVLAWPLDDAPWRRAGGVYAPGVGAAVAAGSRLDRILLAAEAHPDLPLTYLPGPHLLEDLADRADGFARVEGTGEPEGVPAEDPEAIGSARFLDRMLARLQAALLDPVAAAYADTDIAALNQAPDSLDGEAASAVARGRMRLADVAGRVPEPSTYWASTALDTSTLDVLVNQAATDRVLLPFDQLGYEGELDAYPDDLPGPLVRLATPSGRRLLALVPDPYVDRTLREPDEDHGPIVAAQRVLAETAVLWTELPLTPRPLVLMPPPGWDPPGRFGRLLLDGVVAAPWLQPGAPSDLDVLAVGRDESVGLPVAAGSLSDAFLRSILTARRELAAVQEALPDTGGLIAGRSVDELELQLLRAPSAWFVPGGAGRALVDDVLRSVDAAYGVVDVAEGARITLTSDSGHIPVTLQRPAGGPLRVLLSIEGAGAERANLAWPEGRVKAVTLPGTGAQTYSFAVRARSTGSFGVTVRVTDPAGVRELAQGQVTIRSTAISGPALGGTAIVVALLLVVGFARRRPDRPRLEVVG